MLNHLLLYRFLSFCVWPVCTLINPPARTTMTVSSVCPKCGTIAKSGKMSCCGRGGSWFKNCGGAGNGNTRLHHTWYEGIQSCTARTQSRTADGQQGNAAQRKRIGYFYGADKANSTGLITAAKSFTFSPANIFILTSIPATESIISTSRNRLVSTSTVHATLTINSKGIYGVSMPVSMSTPTSNIRSSSTSVTVQGFEKLLNVTLHISVLIIIVFSS